MYSLEFSKMIMSLAPGTEYFQGRSFINESLNLCVSCLLVCFKGKSQLTSDMFPALESFCTCHVSSLFHQCFSSVCQI